MKSFPVLPYALAGLAVVVWWAVTESWIAAGVMLALFVVAAIHVIKITSAPGSVGTAQDEAEGHVRATFPTPPERPHGI
ncbi:hypothetical protein [Serinicoccus kebangsaanensis]|uniref:hypothetical protein n=1 Tax=Serinicoccus kebangsaanensis TaxID=2602069 RepID=UPI00124BCCA4|nr:hypothetical protein [Serinicoccus kebangsaanensis]